MAGLGSVRIEVVTKPFSERLTGLAEKMIYNLPLNNSEGPLHFFRDAWMGIFALRETWMRVYFFRDLWIYFLSFRPRETGSRFFRDPWNMHFLNTRDLGTNGFYGNNSSLFGDVSVIEARKLDQTRWKSCPFDALADMENQEGLEYTIRDKSLGTNLHFWRFCAHFKRKYNFTCLTSPPTPHTMLKTTTCNFFWFSTVYWEGRGKVTFFKRNAVLFFQTSEAVLLLSNVTLCKWNCDQQ